VQSTPQHFDYTRNSVNVLQRNTTIAPETANPQRLLAIVLVVIGIVVVGFANGRLVVLFVVTRAAGRDVKTDIARFGFVQGLFYGGGMRST
jgi:hypothetical protein